MKTIVTDGKTLSGESGTGWIDAATRCTPSKARRVREENAAESAEKLKWRIRFLGALGGFSRRSLRSRAFCLRAHQEYRYRLLHCRRI